ncbi:MAG TPA: tetratricopeptide repeat protein [Ignavibacteriaceae bacterium]|nr:tetratricopeptide repeat protein [Ignavibacteriaceae bacterium]
MRRNILFLNLIIFFVSSLMLAQQDTTNKMNPQAAKYFNQGIEALKQSNYDQAVVFFDSSLAVEQNYLTYFQKGFAYLKNNQLDLAKENFNKALSMNNTFDLGYFNLAQAHLRSQEYDKAVENYKKAAEVTTNDAIRKDANSLIENSKQMEATDYFNKGNELQKNNQFEEALAMYDKSLEIFTDAKAHYQKGIVYFKMKQNDQAMQQLKESIAEDDSFDQAYIALAGLYLAEKNYDSAIVLYKKASTVASSDEMKQNASNGIGRVYLFMGNASLKDKKYDKAIDELTQSTQLFPNDQGYLSLARAYIEKKKYDDALTALDSADSMKKNVTEGAIAYYKGIVYKNKGDKVKASENFKAALNDPVYKKAAQSEIANLNPQQQQKQGVGKK